MKLKWLRKGSLIMLLAFAGHTTAAENPVRWSLASLPQKPLHSGATFTAKLLAQIDAGWHLYALEQEEGGPIPTEISLADPSSLILGTIRASKPVELLDPNFNMRVGLYIEKAEFTLLLTISHSAPRGAQRSRLRIRYQCCNDTMCLPPRTVLLDLTVSVNPKK